MRCSLPNNCSRMHHRLEQDHWLGACISAPRRQVTPSRRPPSQKRKHRVESSYSFLYDREHSTWDMSFAFVPRSVGRSKPRGGKPSPSTAVTVPRGAAVQNPQPALGIPPVASGSRTVPTTSGDDIALLVSLALSDHALWTTPGLRDPNRDGCSWSFPRLNI